MESQEMQEFLLDLKDEIVSSIKEAKNEFKGNLKYQILKVEIDPANGDQVVVLDDNTKIEHEKIVGVFITSSNDQALVGTTLGLNINEETILPDDFEASLINRNIGISINELPHRFEQEANNSVIKVKVRHGKMQGIEDSYTINVYLVALEK